MRKKEIIEIAIIGASIIILLFLSIKGLKKVKQPRLLKTKALISAPERMVGRQEKATFNRMEEATKDLGLRRDPFVVGMPTSEGASVSGLTLSGIVWDKDMPLAIINEDILKTGDMIETYKILKIKEKSIILSNGINDIILTMGEEGEE